MLLELIKLALSISVPVSIPSVFGPVNGCNADRLLPARSLTLSLVAFGLLLQ